MTLASRVGAVGMLVLSLLVFGTESLHAQFLPRDSLLKELAVRRAASAVRDSDYVRLLFLVARSYRPNTVQMRPFVDEARQLVEILHSPRLRALLHLNIGNILRLERRFTEARDTLNLAFQGFSEQRDSSNMSSTAGLIAVLYQQRDMFSMALQYYMQEMEIADKCGDDKNSFLARVNLSEISIAMQQPEKALYFVRQAKPILARIGSDAFRVEWAKSMAAAYRMTQKPDSALLVAQEGVKGSWKLNDTLLVVNLLAQEVRSLRAMQRFDEALVRLDSLVSLDVGLSAEGVLRPTMCALAAEVMSAAALDSVFLSKTSAVRKTHLLEQALSFAKRGVSHPKASKKDMLDLYVVLAKVYNAQGRTNEAFLAQSSLLTLRDSVFTASLHASIADMQERYALAQKEAEIALLQAQERRATMLNLLLTTLTLCGLFVAGVSYHRYRSQERSERALQEANERLQGLYKEALAYKTRIEDQNMVLMAHERKLLESLQHKQFLSIVAGSTSQMVIITDAEGRVQFVNEQFEQRTGYTASEMIGIKPGKVLQGKNTNPETTREIAQALRERRAFEGEIVNYTKEGREYWVHLSITPVFNDNGECEHFLAMQYDVTDQLRKQAEERIQAELTLQSMMASTREIVMLVGADFQMMQFNKTAYKAMREMMPEIEPAIGMDMRRYSPVPLEEVEKDFEEVMKGKSVAFDLDMPNPSNPTETLTFEVNYNPVRNLQGEIIAVSFVARNITKRRQAQAQIEQMNLWLEKRVQERTKEIEMRALQLSATNNKLATAYADLEMAQLELWSKNQELENVNVQLQEANYEKSEILGIVAHDLKSPLSGIQGLAEVLRAGIDTEYAQQAAIEIYNASERMFRLITNLLDVNAIETGKMPINLGPLDVGFIIETIVENYTLRALAKVITINVVLPTSRVYALADEFALPQVVENLVSNAVKYSPFEKQVWVRVKETINTQKQAVVRVEVQDQGPGISSGDMQKLFSKFSRLSAQPTGGEHSTGLGLNIAKKIVEAMKGKIWCESVLGEGATFIVELPKA
ncbi:MAG: ATP-binding protein [Candidatus Kapabacteria bacterium]|nr:ATP-binding protein [Candidatus Kapabacteria bacterium]